MTDGAAQTTEPVCKNFLHTQTTRLPLVKVDVGPAVPPERLERRLAEFAAKARNDIARIVQDAFK